LEDDELSLLSHGLKHALPPPKVDVEKLKTTIIADITAGIREDGEIDIPGIRNNRFEFDIYRRPTAIDNTISGFSLRPFNHKCHGSPSGLSSSEFSQFR